LKVLIANFPKSNHVARLHIIENILLKKNVDISRIESNIWGDNSTRMSLAKKPWLLLIRLIPYIKYIRHVIAEIKSGQYNKMIIGYPSYLDAFFVKKFCKKNLDKIYIDFFLSIYDTIVLDRKMFSQKHLFSKMLFSLEKRLLKSYHNIIVDTNTNGTRYAMLFGIGSDKFKRIYVGSRLILKEFSITQENNESSMIQVGWVGSFIPLHGINTILETANLLRNEHIIFKLIGDGQIFKETQIFLEKNKLSNVKLLGKMSYKDSMNIIANCDVCLGIFGSSKKSLSVIPFKVFDYLYLNKMLITQHSEALSEVDSLLINVVENTPESIKDALQNITKNNEIIDLEKLVWEDIQKILND